MKPNCCSNAAKQSIMFQVLIATGCPGDIWGHWWTTSLNKFVCKFDRIENSFSLQDKNT